MQAGDMLIIAGSSFPYMEFYPKPGQAKCVQIDTDPTRIGLRHSVDVGLVGDCRRILAGSAAADPEKNRIAAFWRKAQRRHEGME